MLQQPLVGQCLLIFDASWSHSDTPHSVGILCTSDQPEAETSTWQHTTLTPGGIRTHNLSKRAAADPRLRPRGHWGSAMCYTVKFIYVFRQSIMKLWLLENFFFFFVFGKTMQFGFLRSLSKVLDTDIRQQRISEKTRLQMWSYSIASYRKPADRILHYIIRTCISRTCSYLIVGRDRKCLFWKISLIPRRKFHKLSQNSLVICPFKDDSNLYCI
jgi:hypothetical protein